MRNVDVYFRKTSFVDYPEKVAAVIFFPFCNLRCPWCHNGGLIDPSGRGETPLTKIEDALSHILKRAAVLDGVVLSGGEPSLYDGLCDLVSRIKSAGLAVKLDTNGTRPCVLAALLESSSPPDYVALDLKFAPERYASLLPDGVADSDGDPGKNVIESARLIREAYAARKIDCEFRSLALPRGEFGEADISALSGFARGVPWVIRPFRPGSCLDALWNDENETGAEELERLRGRLPASREAG